MPDGQVIFSSAGAYPQTATNASLNALLLLLDAATAADLGVWTQMYPFSRGSVDVTGSGSPTFSLQLYGSNQENAPANNTDGRTIGSPITGSGMTFITEPVRWIKAHLTAINIAALVTVSGSVTPTDVVVLRATNAGFAGGHSDSSYTAGMTDTLADIAAGVAAAVVANATLSAAGITAVYTSGTTFTITQTGPTFATLSQPAGSGDTEILSFATIPSGKSVSVILNVVAP